MKIICTDGSVTDVLRNTAAHITAHALKRLYPGVHLARSAATEEEFRYDFDLGDTRLNDNDLAVIENEMRKLVKGNLPFTVVQLSKSEALKRFEKRVKHIKQR